MKMQDIMWRIYFSFILILSFTVFASAQKVVSKPTNPKVPVKQKPTTAPTVSASVQTSPTAKVSGKSSAAFAELAVRKAELSGELKDLLQDYTEEYPEAKKKKTEIDFLQKEMDKIAKADGATVPKLTTAVGKLLVRKVRIQMELELLKADYTDEYPLVQKTRRQLESFENEIKELLQ